MRQILPVLALAFSFAPAALLAETGMCEYRHPAHPGWDFFAGCSWSETTSGAVTTREVAVSNGSKFTTRVEAGQARVNGLAARKLDRDGSECWMTEAENELICIYPADTIRPDDPPATPGTSGDLSSGPGGIDTSFGGGVSGDCLLTEADRLIEHGSCTRRENCLVLAETKGDSCLTTYDWKSGRVTEMAAAEDWVTLDGAAVIAGDPGCVTDTAAGITFCWSKTAMTPEAYPVLAKPAVEDETSTETASDPAE